MPFDNILEFVEGPTGLNWTLLPVQRFILKLHYGIELDTLEPRIPIYDRFQERLRYTLSEVDYLNYLYGEGRCNYADQSTLPRTGLILATGRRTGKTLLAELIASYTVIQMLQMGNPHEVFGFNSPAHHIVTSCYIGLNREMRTIFLSGVSSHVARCSDLQEALVPGQSAREIRFMSPAGRRRGVAQGNLAILALDPRPRIHASARAMLILDELAYMPEEQEIFNANLPTVRGLGRYTIMSTPRRAGGAFYNAFRHAMESRPDSPLALQIPTWEVQPENAGLGPLLRQQFEENPTQFSIEYGAHWGPREVRIEVRV